MHERLQRLITELREELADDSDLDAETRHLLHEAAADLDALAARLANSEHPADSASIQDKLLNAEVNHPRISSIVADVLDLIGKLGL